MSVTIGKTKLKLSMEYERILEIEELTGVGVIAHAGRFSHLMGLDGDNAIIGFASSPVKLSDVVTCLHILCGRAYDESMIGKLVLSAGVNKAVDPLSDFFATAITGEPLEVQEPETVESVTDDSP